MEEDKRLLTNKEVAEYLGVSYSKACDMVKTFNDELKEKGYYTISGRINKRYLDERIFGEVG